MTRMYRVGVGLLGTAGLAILAAGAIVIGGEGAAPDPSHAYAGVKACAICHKSEKQGQQYTIWESQKHAKAFETLKTDASKETAKKVGLKTPPEESPECLKCHATGWNFTAEQKEKFLGSKFRIEDGVQCESCHGPGEEYKKLSTMKDKDLAIKSGLLIQDEKLCRTCHNDTAPSWDPNRFTAKDGTKSGFDFVTAWEKIKHPVPKDAAGKAGAENQATEKQ